VSFVCVSCQILICAVLPGSSVGVILPEHISEIERQHFELLLESLTNLLRRQVIELHCLACLVLPIAGLHVISIFYFIMCFIIDMLRD